MLLLAKLNELFGWEVIFGVITQMVAFSEKGLTFGKNISFRPPMYDGGSLSVLGKTNDLLVDQNKRLSITH